MKVLCFNAIELKRKKAPGDKTKVWAQAAVLTARTLNYLNKGSKQPGEKKSKDLQWWLQLFIDDQEEVPTCNWSISGRSLIDNEDFTQEIHVHLQTLGPYVSAELIVRFIDNPEMLACLHWKKTISLPTAQQWMKAMDYWWTLNPKGQYVDGHECKDVTKHQNDVFLLLMAKLEEQTWKYGNGDGFDSLGPEIWCVVVWYHDESTFYANDHCRTLSKLDGWSCGVQAECWGSECQSVRHMDTGVKDSA